MFMCPHIRANPLGPDLGLFNRGFKISEDEGRGGGRGGGGGGKGWIVDRIQLPYLLYVFGEQT